MNTVPQDIQDRRERRLITHAIYDATAKSWIRPSRFRYTDADLIFAFLAGGVVTGGIMMFFLKLTG